MTTINTKRTLARGTGYGVLIAAVVIAHVFIIDVALKASGYGPQTQAVVANSIMGVLFGIVVYWAYQKVQPALSADPGTDLTLDNDWVHVVCRDKDGNGIVAWDRQKGVMLGRLDPDDTIHEREMIWVLPDDADAVVKAVEKYGREASSTGGSADD